MSRSALIAVGGNSLIPDRNAPDVAHQWEAVRETCKHIVDLAEKGWKLVVTHGNGPQVGFILRRNELAAGELHTTPLDLIVADTQGSIGYMLQQAIRNELHARGIRRPVVAVITQVLVDSEDLAFKNPSKPIGGFLSESEAREFERSGWHVVEDAGRGWRRVVASPKPLEIVEEPTIKQLLDNGAIVIAVGGGGIPVVCNEKGELRQLFGIPAVIDKDWASGLLASHLGVDLFLISTGVPEVSLNFNTPEQLGLRRVKPAEMEKHLNDGHFAPGSMRPKVEAILYYLDNGGKAALVTDPSSLSEAIEGRAGTWVE